MLNMPKVIKDYQTYLKKHTNPKRAIKEKAYLYSDLKHYGVSTGEKRKFKKKYDKQIKELPKKEALKWAKKLWGMPYFEERSFGLRILNLHKENLDLSDMPVIEKFMRESKGWAFLDSLIIPLMHPLIKKDKKAYTYLKKWIKGDDFWIRRSALLAQLLFFREGKGGDKKLFFKFAVSQFDESWIDKLYKDKLINKRAKFFIRKAIGWTLREMSLNDPQTVYNFLRENKSEMSGLSFREGSRRLPVKLQENLKAL